MSRLNVGNLFNENEDGAPVVSGISTFSSPNYFVPPSGTTAQRPSNPGEGMIRFNTDSGHLEYYTGELWVDVIVNNNELGDTNNSNSTGGTGHRGLVGNGSAPGVADSNVIDYVSIPTLGNAQDFGNSSAGRRWSAACASNTRGVWGGGEPAVDTIDFVTIASTGNATDAANLSVARGNISSLSNQTRGIWAGGGTPAAQDVIDYITIASIGNAVDFGNLITANRYQNTCASSVRGIIAGGLVSPTTHNYIEYITISSTGNAQDFGDLTTSFGAGAGFSNSIRGVFSGGYGGTSPYPRHNTIQFITIASTGNSQDFGDATVSLSGRTGFASPTRGISAGGASPFNNTIDFIEIPTTGNAVDFGNLSVARAYVGGCSNGHGGL